MRSVSSSNPTWLKSPRSIPRSYAEASKWKALREKLTLLYVICLFTFYLFYVESGGYNVMNEAKRRAFLILHIAFLSCMGLSFLVQNLLACRGKKFATSMPQLNFMETLSVLYLILVWISALRSAYWPEVIQGLQPCEGALIITFYVMTFLLLSKYGHMSGVVYGVLGATVTLFCLICCAQFLGWNPLELFQDGTVYSDYGTDLLPGQFCGTIGNSNLVALLLVPCVLVLSIALLRAKGKLKSLYIIPVGLSIVVLLTTGISLGIVGLSVALLFSLPFTVPKTYRKRVTVGVLLVCTAGLAVLYFCDWGSGTLHEFHMLLHGEADLSFGSGRLYIWDALLKDMSGHWLLGHGPDTVVAANIEPFIQYNEELGVSIVGLFADAHNSYLNTLYCCGVFTLVVYLAMSAHLFISFIRFAGKNIHIAALGSAFIGISVASFFCISHYSVTPFVWCIMGLLEAEIKRASR